MKAKTKLFLSKLFLFGGVLFWILETLFFIIIYGWHWNAYNVIEKICDNFAMWLITIGFAFFWSLVFDIAELYVKLKTFDRVEITQDK